MAEGVRLEANYLGGAGRGCAGPCGKAAFEKVTRSFAGVRRAETQPFKQSSRCSAPKPGIGIEPSARSCAGRLRLLNALYPAALFGTGIARCCHRLAFRKL
jgi:hypothetical protein